MKSSHTWPTQAELQELYLAKFGDPARTGWVPRTWFRYRYFSPDEFYEALVAKLVTPGCAWIDVGGGRNVFPTNKSLARKLADRCGFLLGVDPSDTVDENPIVHSRIKSAIEDFRTDQRFDVATLRMVAEHIARPDHAAASLARLMKPGGKVVVYTVNKWSPLSIAASVSPFWLHHAIKRRVWRTEEKDTFPVVYKMNTHHRLGSLFQRHGFKELSFGYLDDCRTFHRYRVLHSNELAWWRILKAIGVRYPENCLLGVYEKAAPKSNSE